MTRFLLYVICDKDGDERVAFYAEPWVKQHGGADALEVTIHKDSKWFSSLGRVKAPSHTMDPDDPEFPVGSVTAVLEAWIEKGAPTIKGAADTGSTCPTFVRRYFFYKLCEKDGQEQLSCHSEAQVQEYGGIEARESAMGEHTSWFYPIGSLLFPDWVEEPGEGVEIPFRRIKALVDAWLELGSPWKPGKFARNSEAPPKGHRLDD
jgi:hypothetical protein